MRKSSPPKSPTTKKNLGINESSSESDYSEDEEVQISSKLLQNIHSTLLEWAPVLKIVCIGLICILAFTCRIFSVIKFESIIHEFDPWFNFRTTKYLAQEGFYNFWNWFDSESWYPLGRVIGGTIFPGIMCTAAIIKWICEFLMFPIDIRNVCVFIAPTFSSLTAIATYLFTKEITFKSGSGMIAALFISVVPSYISRSVAGSYDNEGVAIFALVFTFYLFVKSVNTGSILWSVACSFSYLYMVAAWGGYSFIINIIPMYALGMIFLGRFNQKIYVSYSIFYILGTLFAIQIQFVGFQAIKSSEHLASHGVFFILQAYMILEFLKSHLSESQLKNLRNIIFTFSIGGFGVLFIVLTLTGYTKWSGRSMTLLDPTYAKKYIPIIASVSEHQATTWTSYFFDLHFLVFCLPAGFYFCCKKPNYGKLFIGLYGITSIYFSCVMIRLMLVLAPAACVLGGIGVSETMEKFTKYFRRGVAPKTAKKKNIPLEVSAIVIGVLMMGMVYYITHSTWAAGEAYSSPTVVLAYNKPGGGKIIIDDYREAYSWLRQNTPEDAKIMSWWDYGYQITGMANRTVLVDNNTWNNTHIATVGRAMASSEEEAYEICQMLDVDYVLVIFGGMTAYSSDDISKFLWMVRIAGGVFPHIKEANYLDSNRNYRVDAQATDTMKNCLMYKLCYYRFADIKTSYSEPAGYDTVRRSVIGNKNVKLEYFTEAFTSERWIVRIYKVNKPQNRSPGLTATPELSRSITMPPTYSQLPESLTKSVTL